MLATCLLLEILANVRTCLLLEILVNVSSFPSVRSSIILCNLEKPATGGMIVQTGMTPVTLGSQ